jgi:hypothetical protein
MSWTLLPWTPLRTMWQVSRLKSCCMLCHLRCVNLLLHVVGTASVVPAADLWQVSMPAVA